MSNSFAHHPQEPVTPEGFQSFPSWRYGPNGEAKIFEREEDIPEGWVDHPSKLQESTEEPKVEEAPQSQPNPETVDSEPQLEPEPVTAEVAEPQEPVAPQVENPDQPAASEDSTSVQGGVPEVAPSEPESIEPLSLDEIKADLEQKPMNDLYKIAGDLGLEKAGKKPELIDRIAQKLHEESTSSPEPTE